MAREWTCRVMEKGRPGRGNSLSKGRGGGSSVQCRWKMVKKNSVSWELKVSEEEGGKSKQR